MSNTLCIISIYKHYLKLLMTNLWYAEELLSKIKLVLRCCGAFISIMYISIYFTVFIIASLFLNSQILSKFNCDLEIVALKGNGIQLRKNNTIELLTHVLY